MDPEEFLQLNMRTTDKIIIDFNPSDTDNWIYPLKERLETSFIHSTYKDNPFLEKAIVTEIENLINLDQDYYNVYALGLPAKNTHTVYSHQQIFDGKLENSECEIQLGLDFGYQHPTALVMTQWHNEKCYVKELLYEQHLTTAELIDQMNIIFQKEGLSKSTNIACDYARPEIIEELVRNGFNAVNAIKNVKEGIDAVKTTPLFIYRDSVNLLKEFRLYKWKMVRDKITDEVVKMHDDAMDALRYAILYKKRNSVTAGSWSFEVF